MSTQPTPSTRRRSLTKSARSLQSPVLSQATGDGSKNRSSSITSSQKTQMAAYRARSDHKFPPTPLVDHITNKWRESTLEVSDEDESFHAPDDDFFVHPKWKAMASAATSRIPRRVQRYFAIYFALLIITYFTWKLYVGPEWHRNVEELRKMDNPPMSVFGSNRRPGFTDMIHMKTLDSFLVPGAVSGNEKRRLIFVGDVHGCREELEALLKKVGFQEDNDHLVLTGDIIAKGPDSPGVVSLAQRLSASCVRGNHEDKVLLSLHEMRLHHVPLQGPEEDPLKMDDMMDEESFSHGDYKVRKLAKQFSREQVHYLQQAPVILKIGSVQGMGEIVVVHAGLVPGVPLEHQDPYEVMNMRSIDLDTHIPKDNRKAGTPWEKYWNHYQRKQSETQRKTVIYGHDSRSGKNIKEYSKGLDSGCVNGGKLTALVVEVGKSSTVSVKCKNYR